MNIQPAIESVAYPNDAVEAPSRRTVPQNQVDHRSAQSHLRQGKILDSIDDKLVLVFGMIFLKRNDRAACNRSHLTVYFS